MQRISFGSGVTIGQIGSEFGVIIQDFKHPLGARLMLEKFGRTAPYSITCGIYGCMVHTRFFATDLEAFQQFNLMAIALDSILSTSIDDDLNDSIGRFVEQFP